jgi:hypothetical protein
MPIATTASTSQVKPVGYKEAAPAGRERSSADVIAANASGTTNWPDQEESEVTEFASDRALGLPRAVQRVSADAPSGANLVRRAAASTPVAGVFRNTSFVPSDTIHMPSATSSSPIGDLNAGPILGPGSTGPVGSGPISSGQIGGAPMGMGPEGFAGDGEVVEGDGMGGMVGNPGFAPSSGGRHFYIFGEYLLWWLSKESAPVLATTSAPQDFGILGQPTTRVLFGGGQIGNSDPFSGARFRAGYWFDSCMTNGIDLGYFFLGSRSTNFFASSSQFPVLGRPFFNLNSNQEFSELTALPGVTTGNLVISAPTHLWGAEANWRRRICCGCNYRLDALLGFRFLNLSDGLNITENVQGLPTAPAPFTNQMITVTDTFSTSNQFYGGQIGIGGWYYWGRLSVNLRTQVALGDTVQGLNIVGNQRFVAPDGTVQTFQGGLLAVPGNIGHFSNNTFSVVPEVGINLGYQVTNHLRAYVGYNFLYWSNVVRASEQIDRNIDITRIPNFNVPGTQPVAGTHPAAMFHETGFWAQGITFGLQFLF